MTDDLAARLEAAREGSRAVTEKEQVKKEAPSDDDMNAAEDIWCCMAHDAPPPPGLESSDG